ncbi:MAG: glycosyltransferase family protein [Rhodospirillales bacterium]|nr:glycosyltransferase family protein [Rhodospirillales bacterium]
MRNAPPQKKVIAIVQARLGSTRLSGKVLLDVCGKPLLWHVMRRVMASTMVDETILTTADNDINKPIVDFAAQYGFSCYAGSEIDLLDRFYQPCKTGNADIVVRITADCPLVDPVIIDNTIRYYIENQNEIDYVNCNSSHKLPDGLDTEVFSMETLESLWKNTKGTFEREWFTTNIFEHPDRWRLGNMNVDQDYSQTRWTVDYPEDMELIREIFAALDNPDTIFGMNDILQLLKERPELDSINDAHKYRTDAIAIEEARKEAQQS